MADIQQWRRKIQPARSRTPATPFLDSEDVVDDFLTSTTPKKRPKPKLSSYFGNNAKLSLPEEPVTTFELPAWPADQFYPEPKPEEVLDMMMCTIMAAPYQALESRHNSSLMLIFESYLNLLDEKKALQERLELEAASGRTLIAKFNIAEKDWADEKQDYKDELKRLEVLLAKASKRGLAEVTLARQDSKLRSRMSRGLDRKETIFEFLEKSMLYDDKTWSNQRAIMKPIIQAANDKDTQASLQLVQKKSMTHLHADLPFGTPPKADARFSLTNATLLEEEQGERRGRKRAETASTLPSTSEDTFSTFSCEEATSPDDTVRANLRPLDIDDYSSIEKIAETLAQRRSVDPSLVMPQLLQMFNAGTSEWQHVPRSPPALTTYASFPKRVSSMRSAVDATNQKPRTVMSKASGFFHKLLDTSISGQATRRFSFEPGDDIPMPGTPDAHLTPHNHKDCVLRKSASAYALRGPNLIAPARSLSPVAHSPTTSNQAEGRFGPTSRIPTPVFKSGSLARPRQEREDSAASLLTAIQNSDNWRRSVSSSSLYSSPGSRVNRAQGAHEAPAMQSPIPLPSNDSHPLLIHTNCLRGPGVAAAATRATSSQASASPSLHLKRSGSQASGDSLALCAGPSVARNENIRPSI